jgi:hypothetical protein
MIHIVIGNNLISRLLSCSSLCVLLLICLLLFLILIIILLVYKKPKPKPKKIHKQKPQTTKKEATTCMHTRCRAPGAERAERALEQELRIAARAEEGSSI